MSFEHGSLAYLVALDDIKTLKSRYFRALDDQDWVRLGDTLVDDLEFHHPTIGDYTDADAMVSAVRERVQGIRTVHQGHDPEIEISGDEARGRWGLESFVFSDTDPTMRIPRFARYEDRLRYVNGRWKISRIDFTYIFDGAV